MPKLRLSIEGIRCFGIFLFSQPQGFSSLDTDGGAIKQWHGHGKSFAVG